MSSFFTHEVVAELRRQGKVSDRWYNAYLDRTGRIGADYKSVKVKAKANAKPKGNTG